MASNQNGIYISGDSLKLISIAFSLFGVLFIVNTIMCCYNCYSFSLYLDAKQKKKLMHFDEEDDYYEDEF